MKFKLDENFGQSVLEVFKRRGFDCHTVHDEGLVGAAERAAIACQLGRPPLKARCRDGTPAGAILNGEH